MKFISVERILPNALEAKVLGRFRSKGTASRLGGGLRGARRASSQECTHNENGTLAAILELTIRSSLKNYVTEIQKSPQCSGGGERCGLDQ